MSSLVRTIIRNRNKNKASSGSQRNRARRYYTYIMEDTDENKGVFPLRRRTKKGKWKNGYKPVGGKKYSLQLRYWLVNKAVDTFTGIVPRKTERDRQEFGELIEQTVRVWFRNLRKGVSESRLMNNNGFDFKKVDVAEPLMRTFPPIIADDYLKKMISNSNALRFTEVGDNSNEDLLGGIQQSA